MSQAFAGMIGQPPSLLIKPSVPRVKELVNEAIPSAEVTVEVVHPKDVEVNSEQEKYKKMWAVGDYRKCAPGEQSVDLFLKLAAPSKTETVIDFGAGTGRAAMLMALIGGVKVHMLDFADNCLDVDVRNALETQRGYLRFSQQDLRQPIPHNAKYGYCTDVMEHIPPEEVDRVLHHILKSAQHVFFQISTEPDNMGVLIGEQLHLTVQPFEWWEAKLKEHEAIINWSGKGNVDCAFYVTAWQSAQELIRHGTLNTDDETVHSNIKSALERNLSEVRPYEKTDIPVMILAGGPSMKDFKDEIVRRRSEGEKLITVNGAYNWALENGIKPSAQIMVDSREFNKRFLEPTISDCHYLLASQCHPEAFNTVPHEQTMLWHSALSQEMIPYLEKLYSGSGKPMYPILGGSTVMLRALPLMVLLGYSRFELFGFDSCLMSNEHHAYQQLENDHTTVLQVLVNDRTFNCHPWMVSQAQEFLDLMQLMSEHIELVVRGDGLIAWLVQTAAEMDSKEVKIEVQSETEV